MNGCGRKRSVAVSQDTSIGVVHAARVVSLYQKSTRTVQVCQIKPQGYDHTEGHSVEDACVSLMIQLGEDWVAGKVDAPGLRGHRYGLVTKFHLKPIKAPSVAVALSSSSSSSNNINSVAVPSPIKVPSAKRSQKAAAKGGAQSKKKPKAQMAEPPTGVAAVVKPPSTMAELAIPRPRFLMYGEQSMSACSHTD